MEVKRSGKSLIELALFSLERRRSWSCWWAPQRGDRGAEPLRWRWERHDRHKLEHREFPLEIRRNIFHHEGDQNWTRFTREVQACVRHDPE